MGYVKREGQYVQEATLSKAERERRDRWQLEESARQFTLVREQLKTLLAQLGGSIVQVERDVEVDLSGLDLAPKDLLFIEKQLDDARLSYGKSLRSIVEVLRSIIEEKPSRYR